MFLNFAVSKTKAEISIVFLVRRTRYVISSASYRSKNIPRVCGVIQQLPTP